MRLNKRRKKKAEKKLEKKIAKRKHGKLKSREISHLSFNWGTDFIDGSYL